MSVAARQRPGASAYFGFLAEDFLDLRFSLVAAEGVVEGLASVEADEVGEEADLRFRPFAVGAVYLAVDVAGIDEEDGVGSGGRGLALVEEPERARQRHGVEHVRANGDHHIHGAAFDEFLPDFLFGGAGVGGGVGHDESGPPVGVQRGVEELNPEIVGVVGARQAKGVAAACADGVLQPFLVHGVDVERRIGEDEVETSGGVVRVVVVAVDVAAVADFAFEAVDGEVHPAEATGFVGLLNAVDGEFGSGVLLVLRHEARRLDEHAARTAGGVEDESVVGFDDFREQTNDGARRIELAPALTFAHGELAEEVLINAPEGVVVERAGDLGDFFQELLQESAGE